MILVITGPAIADLREIGSYIAFESPSRAEKVNDGLEQACLRLAESPERYLLVPHLGPNIRRMAHRSYLIFYRAGVTVEVLRVIHGARRTRICSPTPRAPFDWVKWGSSSLINHVSEPENRFALFLETL